MEIIKGKQLKPVKGVIYGIEGVGKSSLAAKFPRPLFIDAEGGTSRLEVDRVRPTSWAHLRQIIGELVKDQQGYETLVFDTADWIERLAIQELCAETGTRALGEGSDGKKDYGKSYNLLAEKFGKFLDALTANFWDNNKMHVVFLAHAHTKLHELPEEDGQYDRYQIAMEKKTAKLLKDWCDLLLFCNYKTYVTVDEKTKKGKAGGGTLRKMYAQHCAAFDAKNRDDLPREMDLDVKHLATCFAVPLAAGKPTPPAAPAAATPKADAEPTPQPAAGTAPALAPHTQALKKLMEESGVTYDQVLGVLVARGKYPENTPMENIDAEFVNGFIFPHWEKIREMIKGGASAAA